MRARSAGLAMALVLGALAPLTSAVSAVAADETVTTRINTSDPTAAAIDVAQRRFADDGSGGREADHVVLSRDDEFADSLAGSALTGDGALLFTDSDALTPATEDEIDRLLGLLGRVYVLGGVNAVSDAVVTDLRAQGYDVQRLWGADRIATALAVADEVRAVSGITTEVMLARARGLATSPGSGWADSVAGGGVAAGRGMPILLTATDSLDPGVDAWLDSRGVTVTHLLGGPAALANAVAAGVPGAVRHFGADRTGTAAAIAIELAGAVTTGPRAFTIVDAARETSWAFGLAAAGLAADNDAPVLLTTGTVTVSTRRLVATCGTPEVDLTIVGDGQLVSGAVREYLEDLDGEGCGPDASLRRRPDLQRFADCDDLLAFFRTNALERVTAYGLNEWYGYPVLATTDDTAGPEAAPAPSGEAADAGGTGSGGDVSTTNVQEAGVDEPDLVKTDGSVLVHATWDQLRVVDLTGASPVLAATITPEAIGQHELLLSGDTLLVMTTSSYPVYAFESDISGPYSPPRPTTLLTRYDLSDPTAPVLLSTTEIDGWYRAARMIDGVARIVTVSGAHDLPFTWPEDDSEEAQDRALEHNRQVVEDSTIDNWLPFWGDQSGNRDLLVDCAAVHEPPAWSGFDNVTVFTLDIEVSGDPGAAATVVASGETIYASLDRLVVTTSRWGDQYESVDSTVSTELHAFDISSPTALTYQGSGAIDGFVLNQFSLSEFGGNYRVAATKQPPWTGGDGGDSSSFVAVLTEQGDGDLVEIGRVGNLGLGEQIQAVRFLGDLGFVVTFRQVDPLYIIDLSAPTAPRIVGELKDDGYSAYLHRVSEDLLLGVGVAADKDGRRTGAQVALYDISDLANPTLADEKLKYLDSYTEVEYDHRAFLYWPATGNAFVPIQTWTNESSAVGAAVLDIGTSGTLAQEAYVSHMTEGDVDNGTWVIRRSIVVRGMLLTVSDAGLAEHDLAGFQRQSWLAWPAPEGGEVSGGSGGPDEPPPPTPLEEAV